MLCSVVFHVFDYCSYCEVFIFHVEPDFCMRHGICGWLVGGLGGELAVLFVHVYVRVIFPHFPCVSYVFVAFVM